MKQIYSLGTVAIAACLVIGCAQGEGVGSIGDNVVVTQDPPSTSTPPPSFNGLQGDTITVGYGSTTTIDVQANDVSKGVVSITFSPRVGSAYVTADNKISYTAKSSGTIVDGVSWQWTKPGPRNPNVDVIGYAVNGEKAFVLIALQPSPPGAGPTQAQPAQATGSGSGEGSGSDCAWDITAKINRLGGLVADAGEFRIKAYELSDARNYESTWDTDWSLAANLGSFIRFDSWDRKTAPCSPWMADDDKAGFGFVGLSAAVIIGFTLGYIEYNLPKDVELTGSVISWNFGLDLGTLVGVGYTLNKDNHSVGTWSPK